METQRIKLTEIIGSNTVKLIGFSENKLYVVFNTDILYRYDNVSQDNFIDITNSESVGAKLKEIVDNKPYKKLANYNWFRDLQDKNYYLNIIKYTIKN